MRKGFTIIELLVASMLLGMLVTILTMIFNQSAIAWRTGKASVADLDDVRDNMAEIRTEADNVFVANGQVQMITGIWDAENGKLRTRACDAEEGKQARVLSGKVTTTGKRIPWRASENMVSVGQQGKAKSAKTYTVNVKSRGPDGELATYDDIWSWPDDFD